MKIVSACLAGINCNYKGESAPCEKVIELVKQGKAIPICPEQLGGQPTPRPGAEIKDGNGLLVLNGEARVVEPKGNDVTKIFIKSAEEVLKIAKLIKCNEAILKQRSPSCGCGEIYDGTFSKKIIEGDGVTTALLKRNGINVISEEDL